MKGLAKQFKALSHDIRLTIMVLLSQKELCVCQIEKLLNLSQAKVSRHLTVLKHAGLVVDRREGLWIYYSATKPKKKCEIKIFEIFSELKATMSRLKIHAATLKICGTKRNEKKRNK